MTSTMTRTETTNNYYNRNHDDDELIMTMTMFIFQQRQPAVRAIVRLYRLIIGESYSTAVLETITGVSEWTDLNGYDASHPHRARKKRSIWHDFVEAMP